MSEEPRKRVRGAAPGAPLPCRHYPHCAGCAFIGAPYGEQLVRKRQRVREALAAHVSLAPIEVPEVVGSPRAFGYRNQAKLVARRARRGLLLGVYRPGTHQVVDISECPVHDAAINDALAGVRRAVEQQRASVYDERTRRGLLRYVVLRASRWTKAVQVILVVGERDPHRERKLGEAVRRLRGVRSVVLNLNPSAGNVIFGETFLPLTREASLIERVGDLKLKSRAGAFLQANIPAARKVYDRVLRWADPQPEETVIDLYCGVGAISFWLAGRARRVWGIEESPLAVLDAKENIRLNGFHNVRFLTGTVAATLPAVAERAGRVDLVTLNPPRKGADVATRAAIVGCRPKRVVYISCDPVTLARDLDWFAARGYPTERVQPFDLLPQTDHVECVALLTNGE